jgi:hypothetical protein
MQVNLETTNNLRTEGFHFNYRPERERESERELE